MQTDTNLLFVGGPVGGALSFTTAATVLSPGTLDLATGLMVSSSGTYNASPLSGGRFLLNLGAIFGEDLGPGALRLRNEATISVGFTGGTSLNIQIVGLVDAGTGYPVTFPAAGNAAWAVFAETGAIPAANLAAAAFNPNRSMITLPDWPDRQIATAMPRFIALQFVSAGTFTAGTINSAGTFLQKPDFYTGQYPGGFQVAP